MKLFLFSVLVVMRISTLTAQDPKEHYRFDPDLYKVGNMYTGYIITSEGDTTRGFIKAGARCNIGGIGKSNQNFVEFYTNENDTKPSATYKPNQIRGYKVAHLEYESIAYSGGLTRELNFNLIKKKGAIKTYEWFATAENYQTYGRFNNETWEAFDSRRFVTKEVFSKDKNDAYDISMLTLGFVKKIVPMVQDHAELAKKITDKEKGYNVFGILNIIEEYNEWKKSN